MERQTSASANKGLFPFAAAATLTSPQPETRQVIQATPEDSRQRKLQAAIARIAIALAVIFTCRYFYWRATATMNPVAKWFFYVFIVAEILNFVEAFLFYYTAWSPTRHRAEAAPPGRTVDVFITTYNEPPELLRETVACAVGIQYPHKTYILDDGDRPQVQELAHELGCGYLARRERTDAKAGNLNHGLKATRGEFIVVLDADHVPTPELVDELLGFFRDPHVATVQARQDFYNLDSFQHRLNRAKHFGWQQQDLFFSVIQPGKDRHNAAFYCGSPAIIRRSALEEIGGFATGTITEDMHTSLRLQRRGWRTIYHNETVAYGLAPQTFSGFSTQWYRWGYGGMQVLRKENPIFSKGLTLSQRICYFASFYFYWMSYQKLIYVATPVFCLLTGIFPLVAEARVFARYFLPYLLFNFIASCLLQGGWRNFLLSEEFNLLKIQVLAKTVRGLFRSKARFAVTPKSQAEAASWRDLFLPLAIIAGLAVALVIGTFRLAGQAYGFRFWAFAVNWFWAAFYMALFAPGVWRALRRAERRTGYRFPSVDVPLQITYEDASGQSQRVRAHAHDLNRSGLLLLTQAAIPIGTLVKMAFELNHRPIWATGRIRRQTEQSTHGLRGIQHGVEFERINPAVQDTISKYLFWNVAPREDALLRLTPCRRSSEQHEA